MANYNRTTFTTTTAEEGVVYDYMQDEKSFIAADVFSPKPVDRANKKITQMDISKLKVYDTQRATNSEAEIINEGSFTRDISLKEHKLEFEINPQLVRDSDLQILDGARPIQMATHGLLMKRESIAATLATTSGNYPSSLTSAIASGDRWNEANGDPEADMTTARTAVRNLSGVSINALAIDVTTFDKLRLSPSFRDRVKFTKGTFSIVSYGADFFAINYPVECCVDPHRTSYFESCLNSRLRTIPTVVTHNRIYKLLESSCYG